MEVWCETLDESSLPTHLSREQFEIIRTWLCRKIGDLCPFRCLSTSSCLWRPSKIYWLVYLLYRFSSSFLLSYSWQHRRSNSSTLIYRRTVLLESGTFNLYNNVCLSDHVYAHVCVHACVYSFVTVQRFSLNIFFWKYQNDPLKVWDLNLTSLS